MEKTALIVTACDKLLTYGLWDGRTKTKRWIKKHVFRKPVDVEDLIFWPTGLLAVGLSSCRREVDASLRQRIDLSLMAYFARWEEKKNPVHFLDDLVAGESFLAIYEEYSRDKAENNIISDSNALQYQRAIDKLAEYALFYPTDEAGSLPYRAGHKTGHVYVDSIGQICPFLYEYGTFFERDEYMELAVRQITNFLAYGMDGFTGLPYHGYTVQPACKYGIIGWGRAVGWLLRGMAGCMATGYGMERLQGAYISLVDTALDYQRKDGYFSWQLQAVEGPVDTSATGMICAAIKRGIQLGTLTEPKYGQALQAGSDAVERSVRDDRVNDCLAECEGFGRYPQEYGAYPWALGPALML